MLVMIYALEYQVSFSYVKGIETGYLYLMKWNSV
jgi:hypothetical protein